MSPPLSGLPPEGMYLLMVACEERGVHGVQGDVMGVTLPCVLLIGGLPAAIDGERLHALAPEVDTFRLRGWCTALVSQSRMERHGRFSRVCSATQHHPAPPSATQHQPCQRQEAQVSS